jgi:hypothetical protein
VLICSFGTLPYLCTQEAEDILANALSKNDTSAWLHALTAQYIATFRGNKHVELLHLSSAEACQPSWDCEYFLFERRTRMRMAESKSSASMSALSRAKFDDITATRDEMCVTARQQMIEFWLELLKQPASQHRLHKLALEIDRCRTIAEECFRKQIVMAPNSIPLLKRFATFSAEVLHPGVLLDHVWCAMCGLVLTPGVQQSLEIYANRATVR